MLNKYLHLDSLIKQLNDLNPPTKSVSRYAKKMTAKFSVLFRSQSVNRYWIEKKVVPWRKKEFLFNFLESFAVVE